MVFVQGGLFTMWCTSEQVDACRDDEKPAHQVVLSDFYIGKYEVTQAQWKEVMGNNPSNFQGDNLPVENVSWEDVQFFITRLNTLTEHKYRLPTEAEWEYAARGGRHSRGYVYSGGNHIDEVAWYWENSSQTTNPVGMKMANELGIYDMSGNVWEWINDWGGTYSSGQYMDPQGPDLDSRRVIRGGSWHPGAAVGRVSLRSSRFPFLREYNLGFRLARSAK